MARARRFWMMGFAALALFCPACMAPGAAAPAPAAGAAAAPAAPASADPDLAPPTGLIGKMCAAIDDCRRKLCKAPCGQLINGMTAPISGLTGGVIPSFCPEMPGLKDLMKPGVMGEAAAVKKDALEAKARRDAVRMLGTVDCRYYADAEGKLILALRTDGSECVRYEAALALGHGCCCTRNVIAALDVCVSGLDTDGNPAERSDRVREVASYALEHCLSCAPPAPPDSELPVPDPKGSERPKNADTTSEVNDENKPVSRRPDAKTIAHARETLAQFEIRRPVGSGTIQPPAEKSLLSLFKGSDSPSMTKEPLAKKALPSANVIPPAAEPPARMPVIRFENKPDLNPAASLRILPQD
jgi:hypothetical protein